MRVIRSISSDIMSLIRNGTISNNMIQVKRWKSGLNKQIIIRSGIEDVPLPHVLVHRYIWQNLHKWPNHVAIECGKSSKKFTYSELYERCKRFSISLQTLGFKNGDKIAIILPNIPEYPVAYLGALESALVPLTLHIDLTKDEIIHQMGYDDVKCVICHPTKLSEVQSAIRHLKKNIIIICSRDLDGSASNSESNIMCFEEMMTRSSSERRVFKDDEISLKDLALITHSSGTTGLPKGVCLTHGSITAHLAITLHPKILKINQTQRDAQDIVPGVLPFSNAYGNVVLMLTSLYQGAKIITLPKFNSDEYRSILQSNKNVVVFAVAPMVFWMGSREEFDESCFRGVKEMMISAAPCSSHDIEKLRHKAKHVRFSQGFGMTESSGMITMLQNGISDNLSSVGQLVPNTEAKVIKPDDQDESLSVGESGELCFRGPQMMAGYLNNEEATARTLDGEGWLHTGDIGHYDENGYFYVTDRLKDIIKVKGYQVAPAEIEMVLRKYPGILEAGVVGLPHQVSGETPVAFVQVEQGIRLQEEDVKQFLSKHLANYKIISSINVVESIPRTTSGKIKRRQLKDMISI